MKNEYEIKRLRIELAKATKPEVVNALFEELRVKENE